jgi:hypothetical protein
MRRIAAALIHHPVLDRQRAVVTTAITNLDLHDIARSAHTYGLSDYFIVHPIAAQRELAERVRAHWVGGSGARRIPDREAPMRLLRIVSSLQEALDALGDPEVWTTSASGAFDLDWEEATRCVGASERPLLLCFGTGWGLASTVVEAASRRLAPIESPRPDGYNHLSVRAAAAIVFDRLLRPR